MSKIAVHTNLFYDDGTVIATDVHNTVVYNAAAYTAELANVAGASYASTLVHDDDGYTSVYASYDGKWTQEIK